MPSCDCNARIRWSTAVWVAAEGAGELDAGAAVGGVGAADCAKPIDGASRAARATLRTSLVETMSPLLGSPQLIVVAVAVAVTEAAASSLVPAPTMPASPTVPAFPTVPASFPVPPAKAVAVPSCMPPPTPGPGRRARRSAVKADGSPGKTPTPEMRYRHRPAEGRDATGDISAMPPGGSDCREGQDRRTDKEREGGRREDDEGRRHCNSDGRRRQNHDRRRQCRAEERASRGRRRGRGHGWRSHRRRWRYLERRRGYCRKRDNDRRRCNIDRRRRNNKGRSEDHAERGADQQAAPCPSTWAPSPTEIVPTPGAAPIPPAPVRTNKP